MGEMHVSVTPNHWINYFGFKCNTFSTPVSSLKMLWSLHVNGRLKKNAKKIPTARPESLYKRLSNSTRFFCANKQELNTAEDTGRWTMNIRVRTIRNSRVYSVDFCKIFQKPNKTMGSSCEKVVNAFRYSVAVVFVFPSRFLVSLKTNFRARVLGKCLQAAAHVSLWTELCTSTIRLHSFSFRPAKSKESLEHHCPVPTRICEHERWKDERASGRHVLAKYVFV